ncbi:putative non-specific serine/threonine protein kinase [Helianthus annuus]|nr:putative non-specific serine/threonine protein kinase [Helianthus annuus]KAJ0879336.1 putative non-specific serine/threonine protein kinase [Helianthus annuus]
MVEWVPHTHTSHTYYIYIYKSSGYFDRQKTHRQIKRIYNQCRCIMAENEMLKNKTLHMFLPAFHK